MALRRWLAAAVISLSPWLTASQAPVPPSLPQRASLAVLRAGQEVCGAVATGRRTITTAAHCFSDGGAPGRLVTLRTLEGGYVTARLVSRSRAADLARLEAFDPLPVWVASAPVPSREVIEPVVLVRPLRGWATTSTWAAGAEYGFRLLTPIRKGDSGSGVFDVRGRSVGVIITCDSVSRGTCIDTGGAFTPVTL